jgi:hypothetical protein
MLMKTIARIFPVLLIVLSGMGECRVSAQQKETVNGTIRHRKPGDPLNNLPQHIEVLTYFGERADISPKNTQVAFMSKIFGDAMVIDIRTRNITCLTCNIPAAAFLRVMHLPTSDYLLIGADHFENPQISRKDADLWFLSKTIGAKPVKIGQKVNEGVAVSKKSLKIAFTRWLPDGTELVVADLDTTRGKPKLVNEKIVVKNPGTACSLEAQDFYDNDTKMTFFCYVPDGTFEVKGIDLLSGEITDFSNAPGSFNEPEGIFPNGYTTVESDRQCEWLGGKRGSANIDIWKLKLDGTGKNFVRLTHFNDYEGGKAANPVVATNGQFMAFQVAKSTDPPGIGHGLLLYWFTKKGAP